MREVSYAPFMRARPIVAAFGAALVVCIVAACSGTDNGSAIDEPVVTESGSESSPDAPDSSDAAADAASDASADSADAPTCVPTGAEVCNDGVDNDCNGLTDCA